MLLLLRVLFVSLLVKYKLLGLFLVSWVNLLLLICP